MPEVTSCEVWEALFATRSIQDVLNWYGASAASGESFGHWAAGKYSLLYDTPIEPEWVDGLNSRYMVATAFGKLPLQTAPEDCSIEYPGLSVHYLLTDPMHTPINRVQGLQHDGFINHLDTLTHLQSDLLAVLGRLRDAGVPFVFLATASAHMTPTGSDFSELVITNYTGLENLAPRQAAVLALYEETVRVDLRTLSSRYIQLAAAQNQLSHVSRQTLDFYRRMAEAAMMFNDIASVRSYLLPAMVKTYRERAG